MTLPRRDKEHHTYGEYLTWSDDRRGLDDRGMRGAPDWLEDGRYGRATIVELRGRTSLNTMPHISIDWDEVRAQLARAAG